MKEADSNKSIQSSSHSTKIKENKLSFLFIPFNESIIDLLIGMKIKDIITVLL